MKLPRYFRSTICCRESSSAFADIVLVIEAPPGAGKTTRVPPALLLAVAAAKCWCWSREDWPRAWPRGASPANWASASAKPSAIRCVSKTSSGPRTRLRFLTEGVLTRRLLSDPSLTGVGTVILDEFHERHLDTRSGAGPAAAAAETSTGLKSSYVGDARCRADCASIWEDCPVLRSEGKLYRLAIEYTPHSPAPLEEQVAPALERLIDAGRRDGDVLVFLPGAAEIRRAARAVEPIRSAIRHLLVLPLHGDLSPAEQDRACRDPRTAAK